MSLGEFETKPLNIDEELVSKIVGLSEKMDPLETLPIYFCPEFVGRFDVKQAMLCMLASPWDSVSNRERIHVLLYGHPGSGKTVFLEHLHNDWGAYFSSADPRSSALKGDARRKDRGVQIFQMYNGGVLCFDDIELMEDIDTIRDVMESGKYTLTKGGRHDEYTAQCRIVGATNDFSHMSAAIRTRFDLVFQFDKPPKEDSVQIWKHILDREETEETEGIPLEFIKTHIGLSQMWRPSLIDKDELVDVMHTYLSGKDSGEDGRWLSSILRIARSIARIRFCDIGENEIRIALSMKQFSDKIMYVDTG
jgi:DNA replicative helicase MCM subunit Mcm2 (Cdc46/Mcm family)